MKSFVVTLFVKPAVILPDNLNCLKLNFPEPNGLVTVSISKLKEENYGIEIQTGIKLKVVVDALNSKDAIKEAKKISDGIMSFITLATGRGMNIPLEEISYESTPDSNKREFIQAFYDFPQTSLSRRKLNPKILISFIDKFTKLDVSVAGNITRAIRWYRLGAMVTDVFDQFNCFWIGFETLNPILQKKLGITDDKVTCPNCKNQWVLFPTVSGIREFLKTKLAINSKIYKNIKKIRNSVMHGTGNLLDLQPLASEYAPKTGEFLFRAICYLLGFKNWKKLPYQPIFRNYPMRGEIEGFLIGNDPLSLGPSGEEPHMLVSHKIKKAMVKKGENITYVGETNLKPCLGSNVKFVPKEIRYYGDSATTGEITRKTLRSSNGKERPI